MIIKFTKKAQEVALNAQKAMLQDFDATGGIR